MTRDELWEKIYRACQEYGRTTDHTDELIDLLIASIVVDEG